MSNLLRDFFLSFIPLFVAIDAIGMIPVFLSLTDGIDKVNRKKLIVQATLTAFIISMVFLFSGKLLFKFLGITDNDFRIAGGIVLLILAITDLLFSKDENRKPADSEIGIVPLGIPLIMGPAALTTILISVDSHGYWMTAASLFLNLIIVWIMFRASDLVYKVIGKGGAKAFAKVSSLFIAAIAVMMIRMGIMEFFKHA